MYLNLRPRFIPTLCLPLFTEYHSVLLCNFTDAFTQITMMNLPYDGNNKKKKLKQALCCMSLFLILPIPQNSA